MVSCEIFLAHDFFADNSLDDFAEMASSQNLAGLCVMKKTKHTRAALAVPLDHIGQHHLLVDVRGADDLWW